MSTKIIYLIIAVIVIAGGLFLFGRSGPGAPSAPAIGVAQNGAEQFQGFSLKDYSGNIVKSSDFKDKPLVINSWASWCPFCRQELPDFAAVQKEFGDKVRIIAVDRGESLDVAKKYSDSQGTTGQLVFLLDPDDSFYKSIGGFSMPETVFVDKHGAIQYHKRGPMGKEEIAQRIQSLLSSP